MKVAIVTAFRQMPENYSLVNDVRDRVKTLVRYGHEVVFFAQEGCRGEGMVCETKAVLPHFRLDKDVINEEAAKKIEEILVQELKDFDLAFTDDLMYLRMYVTYRQAIFNAGKRLPNLKWAHWGHSGIGERLQLKMPNAKYVYMNYADAEKFAQHIGVDKDDVHVIFNDKDPRIFFEFQQLTKDMIDKYDLLNYEVMQVYPMCSTRMDAKGVDKVIDIFAEIKKRGRKVKLVIVNSNARKMVETIENKYKLAESKGLIRDEDIVFTSTFNQETLGGVPRAAVRDLMLLSNLFIFPSISEVCSNVLLEASMTHNLVVLNKDFPAFFDFGDEKSALTYNFASTRGVSFSERQASGGLQGLVDKILDELDKSKSNQQFLRIKNDCNVDMLYKKQYKPLLEWVKQS